MTNSFAPSSSKIHIGPIFHKTCIFQTFYTKMAFFKHTDQEKINFVWDLSLSQQHILMRFGNWGFPPCFAMDINRHLNGLTGETRNYKLKLTSNKYHATQNLPALIRSHGVLTLPDEAERWWFLTVSMGDLTLPTWGTGSVYTISHHWHSVQRGILC